jgi:hypothetical protein
MTALTESLAVTGFRTVIKLMTVDDSCSFKVKIFLFRISSKLPKPAVAISLKSFVAVAVVSFLPSTGTL